MNLPNFLGIGAQKAGTTTLSDVLKQHPQIFIPKIKENIFFDSDRYLNGLEWYSKEVYRDASSFKAIGEFSTGYLHIEESAHRIFESLGRNMKFIVILREPVSRAFSHYLMMYKIGEEKRTFNQAINDEMNGKGSSKYLEFGLYNKQLKRYLKYYETKNFLFIKFDDLFGEKKKEIYKNIQMFLNVSVLELDMETHLNKASYIKSRELMKFIRFSMQKDWVRKLLRFIGFKKLFNSINGKITQVPKVDQKLREKLIRTNYLNDIKELELTTGLNLNNWYHFK